MPSVLFFTELLKSTGLGHFFRCQALGSAFAEFGVAPTFVLNTDGTGQEYLADRDCVLREWLDPYVLSSLMDFYQPAIGIVDSYLAEPETYRVIGEKASTLICFDDTDRIEYPDSAIILNAGFPESNGRYFERALNKDASRLLLGPRYAVLREPMNSAPVRSGFATEVEKVVISTGAEDRQLIGPRLIEGVRKIFPESEITFIVGPAFPPDWTVPEHLQERLRCLYSPGPYEYFRALSDADLGILAGGQSALEAARIGLPTILIQVADNQARNIQGLVSAGAALDGGLARDGELSGALLEQLKAVRPRSVRESMGSKGQALIDGLGAHRILRQVAQLADEDFLFLRPASMEDSDLLLEWANDPDVRRGAFYSSTIQDSEHREWFSRKIKDPDAHIFILELNGKPSGQIRFDRADTGEYEIDYSIDSGLRGRKLGAKLLELGVNRLQTRIRGSQRLVGAVKKENIASRKSFLAAGFEETGEKDGILKYVRNTEP